MVQEGQPGAGEAVGRYLGSGAGWDTSLKAREALVWVWAPEHINGGAYVCVLITRLSPWVHPCRPSSEWSAGQALPCHSPGSLLGPPQPRWSSPAQARLGSAAGLGDYSLFSASLFKAQLSVVPEGPSPPEAAAGRAARELGRCISHCCRDAGPGGPGCFPARFGYFYMLSGPPAGSSQPKRPTRSLGCFCLKSLSSCGPDGAPSVADWWGP